MQQTLFFLLAQINPTVGAIEANQEMIIKIIQEHQKTHDIIVFPELAITGYPPEDLLFREELFIRVTHALNAIMNATTDCHVIIGHPVHESTGHYYNAISVLTRGQRIGCYYKQHLPNDGIFDEKRYFTPGQPNPYLLTIKGYQVGLCICEDLWQLGPVEQLIAAGADIIVAPNASPFDEAKYAHREALLQHHAANGVSVLYVNQVGGQDELVFDGQSFAVDHTGAICARAKAFKEELLTIKINGKAIKGTITPLMEQPALIYQALVCGLRDYVNKNNFQNVLLGLSGGIDSALTLAIAVDALGASRVHAVMLPSRYTASISNDDAQMQLQTQQVSNTTLSIEPAFQTLLTTLAPSFTGLAPDITEENLQARIRGALLMALSNKLGHLLLTTSNKSETAVGYSTLYGDMAGGFAVLKDVLKTQVYALAIYRNTLQAIIPERVISRPPSAELAPNQRDQDSLPDYTTLDAIIELYMDDNLSIEDITQRGYDHDVVTRIITLITRNEYKRRQSAPGVKISTRAFGKDWRYPITSGFLNKDLQNAGKSLT